MIRRRAESEAEGRCVLTSEGVSRSALKACEAGVLTSVAGGIFLGHMDQGEPSSTGAPPAEGRSRASEGSFWKA